MRKNLLVNVVAVFLVAAWAAAASAEVRLPGFFGQHMVLQRNVPVPVWGWANPGEKVTVTLGDQSKTAAADSAGKWAVKLDKLEASGPYTLSVKGDNTIEITDVLVGEVWLCSGQSNMVWPVEQSANFPAEKAAANHPQIRMITVAQRAVETPQDDCKGAWLVCSPQTVGGFSATAYFFGRELHTKLDMPVGLINSSLGATPVEAWTSLKAQQAVPKLKPLLDSRPEHSYQHPTVLYNGMIAPLVPYALRGAIWYQGEANALIGNPSLYGLQLSTMIENWRNDWAQGHFPFIYVQLPNWRAPQKDPVETSGWVIVREEMLRTLSLGDTGMVVTIDIGEADDIHPKNKQDVGKRLAIFALATTYGKDMVYCGPLYKSMSKQDGKVVIRFDHVGDGLMAKGDGPLRGFAIAGKDKKFVWAEAKIEGDTVVISSPEVKDPVAVRYAWADNPNCNLYNSADLPASPFRTDDWAK